MVLQADEASTGFSATRRVGGKRVTLHAHADTELGIASRSGMQSIEHISAVHRRLHSLFCALGRSAHVALPCFNELLHHEAAAGCCKKVALRRPRFLFLSSCKHFLGTILQNTRLFLSQSSSMYPLMTSLQYSTSMHTHTEHGTHRMHGTLKMNYRYALHCT